MDIYLSGTPACNYALTSEKKIPCLLQSFYDMRSRKENDVYRALNICDEFMLDSGVFTFMNTGKRVEWKEYIDAYCDFINKYDIKHFVEMDLDYILDLEKTEQIRSYIENKTGKQTIPVWHAGTRDLEYFKKTCKNYPYVALSTMETPKQGVHIRYDQNMLRQLVKIAHSYGCKVHGLGFMSIKEINNPRIHFDSIDASTWNGGMYGRMTVYKHGIAKFVNNAPKHMSCSELSEHDFKTWVRICEDKRNEQ